MTLLVRTRATAGAGDAVRRELHAMDSMLPVPEIRPLTATDPWRRPRRATGP